MGSIEIKEICLGNDWFNSTSTIYLSSFFVNKGWTSKEYKLGMELPNIKWYLKCGITISESWMYINLIVKSKENVVDYFIYFRVYNSNTSLYYRKKVGTIHEHLEIRLQEIDISHLKDPEKGYLMYEKLYINIQAGFAQNGKTNFSNIPNRGLPLPLEDSKDFEFNVSGQRIKAHKLLLCTESTVLADLLQNTSGNHLDIPEFRFETVKAAVDFCYAQNIFDFLENYEAATELLIFADKFDFRTLKQRIEIHLLKIVTEKKFNEMLACIKFVYPFTIKNSSMPNIKDSFFQENFMITALLRHSLKNKS